MKLLGGHGLAKTLIESCFYRSKNQPNIVKCVSTVRFSHTPPFCFQVKYGLATQSEEVDSMIK